MSTSEELREQAAERNTAGHADADEMRRLGKAGEE